jgi:hypothetical protein
MAGRITASEPGLKDVERAMSRYTIERLPPFSNLLSIYLGNDVPGHPLIPAGTSRPQYLEKELSVQRLDQIFIHLWWAGRPGNIRGLHAQVMMKREVMPCENVALHLVWHDTTIYIKPLPAWLLNYEFFKKDICTNEKLLPQANGLLRTYTRLVAYPSDFKIAQDKGLLPSEVKTWEQWSALAASLIDGISEKDVHRRYRYGELRLRRLNHVSRFWRWGEAYHSVYVQYDHFFAQNFAWLLMLVVYLSVILSSMQVVLATPQAGQAFQDASYWFGVVALIIIVMGLSMQAALFIYLFLFHLVRTILNLKKERMEWVLSRKMQ